MPLTPLSSPPAVEESYDSFELVKLPLPTLSARERSIPIRPGDVSRMLLAEPGLSPEDRAGLTQFLKLIGSVYHYQFYSWLTDLKDLYAPIDPDSDCTAIKNISTPRTAEAYTDFLGPFEAALVRANYVPLDLPGLEKAIAAPNELVRGQGRVHRVIRNAHTWFRKRTITYDAYRRVVIALRYKAGCDLDEYVRSDVLYLRMFKDVPYVEMDMHLPEQGTKIRMRWPDKLQISLPVVTGLPTLLAKLLLEASFSPALMALVLFAPVSAGVRSFLGYRTARKRYLHHMIRHLYYLTLANNASVINRLVDSAEEEEFKEAVLAYYVLWQGTNDPKPFNEARLDAEIERFLLEKSGCDLDFETSDALNKLFRLQLVARDSEGHLVAVPIDRAVQILTRHWDDCFAKITSPHQRHARSEKK
jgi:hypothetical protein